MIRLDINTAVIIHLAGNILLATLIYRVWIQNRDSFEGIGFWFADYVFQAVGTALSVMRGMIPDFISIVISNMLMISGVVLFLYGTASFTGNRIKKWPHFIFLLIFFITYTCFGIIYPNVSVRIAIFSSGLIVICLQTLLILLLKTEEDIRHSTKGISFTMVLFISFYVLRIVEAFEHPNLYEYFKNNPSDAIFVIISHMLTILLTFAIIISINRRLFMEVDKQSQERDKLLSNLKKLATIDNLTGLLNRMKIEEVLVREISNSSGANTPLSILLMDIDHFKNVNDTYGHSEGDRVLEEIASILQSSMNAKGHVGRWGGEEFLAVMPNLEASYAYSHAEVILNNISSFDFENVGQITVSIGLSTLESGESASSIVSRADEALYKAKSKGRNRVEVIDT